MQLCIAGLWCYSTAVNWWLRSANSSNANNFCNVNTDGSANNNNSRNSNGLAPDLQIMRHTSTRRLIKESCFPV